MTSRRMERVNEMMRREVGEYLVRHFEGTDVDIAAVTVTDVDTSPNLREARVKISIRDHVADREHILSRIRRARVDLQSVIGRNLAIKYTPKLHFELDLSIERGDRVLQILHEMDRPRETADGETPAPPPDAPPEEPRS